MTGTSERPEWVQEGLKEADEMAKEELRSNVDVGRLISSSEEQVETVVVNGVNIRFKGFINRALRRKLAAVRKMENDDIDMVEATIYGALSELCLDHPFNKPQTWGYIEDQGGNASMVLEKMMEVIQKNSEDVGKFRKKS